MIDLERQVKAISDYIGPESAHRVTDISNFTQNEMLFMKKKNELGSLSKPP